VACAHASGRPVALDGLALPGALAVQEINGSLLIDAYPTVVETWDPDFQRATVALRRWLWPFTIQNPEDAAGLAIAKGTLGPEVPCLGAFAYVAREPAASPDLVRRVVRTVLEGLAIDPDELLMGGLLSWSPFEPAKLDAALADPRAIGIDFRVGRAADVRFELRVGLRFSEHVTPDTAGPRGFSFCCDTLRWAPDVVAAVGRQLLELVAAHAEPLSGGVLRAPSVTHAIAEASGSLTARREAEPFASRIFFDAGAFKERWQRARRLYPITLLGPKLASQVSAADATAAGALAVQEINGSLLIDAYPEVVETWDPELLRATVELRRWLWPHTIQNPADAAGLGLKLRR
jgi:hypothetical protein